ncbi:MAG: hypothetical protein ACLSAG_19445 [Bacteroides thetaiotaomicron]
MGKKYSINSAGRIVAERDIYSLGGFIPKGRLGGSIKDETQLSQDGECWLAGGSIATRPDIVIKDNAYIGDFFVNDSPVHTDGVMEFSGNTKIPGYITIRCPQADPKNNVVIKDSFIGISMDVLCGPEATTTAFPFGQGRYDHAAAKGTLFENMVVTPVPTDVCRGFADLRIGKDTYVYTPSGYNCKVLWGYYDKSGKLAYSGEWFNVSQALTKLEHPVYNLCRLIFGKPGGLTPEGLLASGAKILGHISGSLLMDLRPESVSGEYVMDNSSFIMPTNNFGLATTQLRFLAGGLYNTNMYTPTNRQDYKPYGTFRNVERLEYTKYLSDSHRTAATRDRYISAYDCPLLRVDDNTYDSSLTARGDLVLRNCIVPKASFSHDLVNGNYYEGIDFSYTNEFIGKQVGNRVTRSSHRQGLYSLYYQESASSGLHLGFISYPDNTKDATSITENHDYIQLDGNIIEQGSYTGVFDGFYEDQKNMAANRVRTGKPLPTKGAVLPSLPAGYKVTFIVYLREDFRVQASKIDPTTLDTVNPYFVMVFGKTDGSQITPSDFIALGQFMIISDYTKVPEITGSAYVGAGVTVRGDVQLHGDPYVNRAIDVTLWEWGSINEGQLNNGWDAAKNPPGGPTEADRRRLKEVIQVEPGAKITCNSGYWVNCYFYDANGKYLSSPGWGQIASTAPDNAAFAGVILKKAEAASGTGYIEDSDIPLANVKYLRAFKRRRYITNELDRKSPEDILLSVDHWEQGSMASGEANAGKTYEELKTVYTKAIRLKRPINVFMPGQSTSQGAGFNVSRQLFDAATKLYAPVTDAIQYKTALITLVTVKSDASDVLPSDAPNSRVYIEFTPSPRIVDLYENYNIEINDTKVRMYDNSVLSKTLKGGGTTILKGDAVARYDWTIGCMCSNGHDDAIIKLP